MCDLLVDTKRLVVKTNEPNFIDYLALENHCNITQNFEKFK